MNIFDLQDRLQKSLGDDYLLIGSVGSEAPATIKIVPKGTKLGDEDVDPNPLAVVTMRYGCRFRGVGNGYRPTHLLTLSDEILESKLRFDCWAGELAATLRLYHGDGLDYPTFEMDAGTILFYVDDLWSDVPGGEFHSVAFDGDRSGPLDERGERVPGRLVFRSVNDDTLRGVLASVTPDTWLMESEVAALVAEALAWRHLPKLALASDEWMRTYDELRRGLVRVRVGDGE